MTGRGCRGAARFRASTVSVWLLVAACAFLAVQGDADHMTPEAIAEKLAQLQSTTPAERAAAAHALGMLVGSESPLVVPALVDALSDPEPAVRAAAAEGLGHMRAEGRWTAPSLAKLLVDPAVEVRLSAVDALGMLGREAADAVPAVASSLEDADPRVRRRAAAALGRFGESVRPAIPALLNALRTSKDFAVREAAVDALAQLNHPKESDDALRAAARDESPEVRGAALRAFGKMGPEHADHVIPVLQSGLSDPSAPVRIEAVHAAHLMRSLGRPLLAAALGDADPIVRWWAVNHLASQGADARDVQAAIQKATADPHQSVRRSAVRALAAIDPAASPAPEPPPPPAPDPLAPAAPSPSPSPSPAPVQSPPAPPPFSPRPFPSPTPSPA